MTYTPTRPIMAAAELAEHHAERHGRLSMGDGYDDMELNEKRGWRTRANWGRDGWDLGAWPFVAISTREHDGRFQILSVVEGDHDVYTFATLADRDAALDYLFLWYMQSNSEDWRAVTVDRDQLDAGLVTVDDRYRGPYRTEGDQ